MASNYSYLDISLFYIKKEYKIKTTHVEIPYKNNKI